MSAFTDLLADAYAARRYLVVLEPYDPGAGDVVTLYHSDHGFVTEPGDSPANQYFEPRVVSALNFERHLFQRGLIGGRSIPNFGEIVLANADGGLDGFLTFGWDGRRVRVYLGGDAFVHGDFGLVFDGTAEQIEITDDVVTVRLRDWQHKLDKPVQGALYAGTGGDEGGFDLTGVRKPLAFGRVLNVRPVMVDPGAGRYQVHDGAIDDVDALYVGGIAYAKIAGTPAANQYAVDDATGFVTVGGTPITEQVTCDVKGAKPGGTYLTTVADIVEEIVTSQGGLGAGDLDAASFTALNTANDATVGIYVDGASSRNVLQVLDELIASIGGYYGFDRSGKFQVGRLEAPGGTPAATFTNVEILDIERQATALPVYRVRLGYQPNWTVQVEFQLQGGATAGRRAFTARDFRHVTALDGSVLTKHPLAGDLEIKTLLDGNADAGTEASRLLDLYKADRDLFRVRVKTQPFALELAETVRLSYPRFALEAGKDFRVIGLVEDAAINEVELTLWG
jgi:hypothetical protein